MLDSRQSLLYVVAVILLPFIGVHMFAASFLSRLLSVTWLVTIFPVVIAFLIVTTKDAVRLRNYKNEAVERHLTVIVKMIALALAALCFFMFTVPTWHALYDVYVRRMPLAVITGTVTGVHLPVLAAGLVANITLSSEPTASYMYWFPTVYTFGDARYRVTVLPGTRIILQVAPN